jgi:hypothetical protein
MGRDTKQHIMHVSVLIFLGLTFAESCHQLAPPFAATREPIGGLFDISGLKLRRFTSAEAERAQTAARPSLGMASSQPLKTEQKSDLVWVLGVAGLVVADRMDQ